MRVVVDLGWWFDTPLGSLGRLWSGLLFVACGALVALRARRAAEHPLRWAMLALTLCVLVAGLRADQPLEGLVWFGHLLTPVVWLLALWVAPPPARAVELWVAALAVPVVIGLGAAVWGQPGEHVLHGWPRLLGAYGNVHTHAGVMAVGAVSAAAVGERVRWARWVALGAGVCLVLTFVRTAWVWAALALAGAVVARRGPTRAVVAAIVMGAGALLALGMASGRLADLGALLTLTPPAGGWGQLGSSRLHIWGDALAELTQGGAVDGLIGRGLGDHQGLHRHLDPHSEVLTIVAQLGLGGLAAWLGLVFGALGLAWRAARSGAPGAALAFGLLLGAAVTAPLSNDWLTRATVALWCWGSLGLLQARPPGGGEPAPAPTPPPV